MGKIISFIILLWVTTFNITAQVSFAYQPQMISALESGDAARLSTFMNNNVELTLLNSDNVFSKSQTKIILDDFFKRNKPSNFSLVHKTEKEKSGFIIGNLYTHNGNFRIYILLKKDNTTNFLIHQLRIENSNE